jgi:hypothetical protein
MLADETMLRIRAAAFWRGPVHAQPANYGHSTALSGRHSNVGFFLKVLLESGHCDCPGLNGSSGSGTIAGSQRASDGTTGQDRSVVEPVNFGLWTSHHYFTSRRGSCMAEVSQALAQPTALW